MMPFMFAGDVIGKATLAAAALLAIRLFFDRRRRSEYRHFQLWARQMQEI